MKILAITNEKGGVGKTFLATQLALYCAKQFSIKTAVIDLDSQGNATHMLHKNKLAYDAPFCSLELLKPDFERCVSLLKSQPMETECTLLLIPAPEQGQDLINHTEQNEADLVKSISYFSQAMDELDDLLDLAIIDTNPNPDMRSTCALFNCTHSIFPIQLLYESLTGVQSLYDRLNKFTSGAPRFDQEHGDLGLLPSMVESTPYQIKAGLELAEKQADLLTPIREAVVTTGPDNTISVTEKECFAAIKRRTVFAEAQGEGHPVWEMPNSDRGWYELKRTFFALLERLDVTFEPHPTPEQEQAFAECKELHPEHYRALVRQLWLSNNFKDLPKLTKSHEHTLALLNMRHNVPLSYLND